MQSPSEDISVQFLSPVEPRLEEYRSGNDLQQAWRDLERRSNPSFFLSWTWIGTWLEVSQSKPLVLEVFSEGRRVGLGLLVHSSRSRLALLRSPYHLHETGAIDQDAVMIEDNGFLAERGFERAVARSALHLLYTLGKSAVTLSGIPEWLLKEVPALGWRHRLVATRGSPYRVLGLDGENELGQLSRNTRSQITGSIRLYERLGPLALTPSSGLHEARERLFELAALHQARWSAVGKPGSFASIYFQEFHKRLLEHGFETGEVDVLKIAAGARVVGYLYNFIRGDSVYSYQNGFDYSENPRLKPGLVSHALAFSYYRDRGMQRYHFLAGDARYKTSLSNRSYRLHWIILERDSPSRRIVHVARNLKAGISKFERVLDQWQRIRVRR
jgi:CelD/BcsL family acetyltransferase involved in cellulose biosynthesis